MGATTTYLGDGGTEEGVGRSLTNHTYRSHHTSVNRTCRRRRRRRLNFSIHPIDDD
jgi:hypothetical protein